MITKPKLPKPLKDLFDGIFKSTKKLDAEVKALPIGDPKKKEELEKEAKKVRDEAEKLREDAEKVRDEAEKLRDASPDASPSAPDTSSAVEVKNQGDKTARRADNLSEVLTKKSEETSTPEDAAQIEQAASRAFRIGRDMRHLVKAFASLIAIRQKSRSKGAGWAENVRKRFAKVVHRTTGGARGAS